MIVLQKEKIEMLRKARIIWSIILIILTSIFIFWIIWQKTFHLKVFTKKNEINYEPGFMYVVNSGIYEKTFFRKIKGKILTGRNDKYVIGYRGGYPKKAEKEIKNYGVDEAYGQLLFYHQYSCGKIYVYDNWREKALFWTVVMIDEQNKEDTKFVIEKEHNFDSITDFYADEKYIYLHIYNFKKEIEIIRVEIENGELKKYDVLEKDLGLVIGPVNWFDPRTEQLMVFTHNGSQKEIQAYSFQTGEKKTIVLEKPASWVLASEDGYLLVNANFGRIIFYAYDMDWNPAPEKDIEIPLVNIADIRRLKPLASWQSDKSVQLADGIAYGCIEGEKALWYYAVDLEAQKVVALWEVRHPKGDLKLQDHFLFHKETGCEPYPTLF
jgi:hypothetical protein